MSSQYAGDDLFPTDYAIPDDSDPRDAASVNVAFEALGDRTKYLYNRVDDAWRVVDDQSVALGDVDSTGTYRTVSSTATWVNLTDSIDPMIVHALNVKAGDRIHVTFTGNSQVLSDNATSPTLYIRGRVYHDAVDASIPGMGFVQVSILPGSDVLFSCPFSLSGVYEVPADSADVGIAMQARFGVDEEVSVWTFLTPMCLRVQVLRKNHVGPS